MSKAETIASQKVGVRHLSDCAVHNAPAFPAGQCDCTERAWGEVSYAVGELWELLGNLGDTDGRDRHRLSEPSAEIIAARLDDLAEERRMRCAAVLRLLEIERMAIRWRLVSSDTTNLFDKIADLAVGTGGDALDGKITEEFTRAAIAKAEGR